MASKTILVVDDEPTIRKIINDALAFVGYEVIQAEDGEAGLQAFREHVPDLLISDVYMPKMNGLLLLRALRREFPEARVMLITGYTNYRQLVDDEKSRPDGYLEKPFVLGALIKQVESLIGTT